jgi:membrane associated rhomboid family serine protease
MAAHDRDYMQDDRPGSPLGWFASLSMLGRLVLLNAIVFFVWLIRSAQPFMADHFTVSAVGLLEDVRVWTLFTSAFSHKDLFHLLFNMILLWVFCPELERIYGKRNVAFLYLLGAFGCSVGHVGLSMATGNEATPMLGASGAVMAVVAVAVLIAPHRRLFLFGVLPLPAWGLGLGFVALDLLGLVGSAQGQASGISHVGHLGGLVAGLAFKLLDLRLFRDEGEPGGGPSLRERLRRRPKLRVLPPLPPEEREMSLTEQEAERERIDAETARRVDDLLRKISESGMDSLTPEEKAFLEEASLKYRR